MITLKVFISRHSLAETTLLNLTPSTTYKVRVAAVNNAGTGVFSDIKIIQTLGLLIKCDIVNSYHH